jgi:hypothetical protein
MLVLHTACRKRETLTGDATIRYFDYLEDLGSFTGIGQVRELANFICVSGQHVTPVVSKSTVAAGYCSWPLLTATASAYCFRLLLAQLVACCLLCCRHVSNSAGMNTTQLVSRALPPPPPPPDLPSLHARTGLLPNLFTEISTSKERSFSCVDFVDTPGLVDGDMKV